MRKTSDDRFEGDAVNYPILHQTTKKLFFYTNFFGFSFFYNYAGFKKNKNLYMGEYENLTWVNTMSNIFWIIKYIMKFDSELYEQFTSNQNFIFKNISMVSLHLIQKNLSILWTAIFNNGYHMKEDKKLCKNSKKNTVSRQKIKLWGSKVDAKNEKIARKSQYKIFILGSYDSSKAN